ncbi:complement decay-accelerating factor-like isoform X2 [Varanus komodoensis]|uniref:complement decay-accelerating factor-like isoform X2 n=1 Tax=Varanus komodoensis TaxID=61221 RepID=UPI001CF7E2EE|nr:complement decay-accelerating factor-like isoform X2 [Varanus komodoensis]
MLGFPLSALNSRLFVLLSVLSEIHGDCGAPPTLKNAVPLDKDYKDSYLPGHSVTYTCLSGFYNIQGKLDVITCLRDSQWSPLEDFCEPSCVKPPRFKFARIEPGFAKAYYAAKSKVNYVCRPGYERILGTTPVVTCRENYTWTEIPDFCKGKSCGHPGKPENGEAVILTDFLYLAKVHFTCEDGYRLMGYPSIQCALNETEVEWQPKPPKCQQITCSPPPNISHSSHDGESIRIFAYNSTVTYKCDHGFSLMGDASIRCATEDKISGVWEGSKPECKGAAGPLCPHCAFRKLHRLPAVGAKPGQFRGEDGFGSEKPLDLGFQLFQHGAGLAYFPATGFKDY